MKKHLSTFVILLVTFLNICICIYILYLNPETTKRLRNKFSNTKSSQSELLIEKTKMSFNSISAIPINPNEKIITPDQDTILLYNVLSDSPKLVFRFNNLACGTCINSELIRLEQILTKDNQTDIVVLCHMPDWKDFLVFLTKGRYHLNIYNTVGFDLVGQLDKQNIPYYVLFDIKCKPKQVFIPDLVFPELSESFVKNSLRYITDIIR